ncbi:MAG: hypothetical protein AAFZ11_00850 [Pseudomonadota bacterium]
MPQAKSHPDQIVFDFSAPAPQKGMAELAGLERQINELVGVVLASAKQEGLSRSVIAAKMSDVLDERVSKEMLDAYSSPARSDHRVPASRLMALLVVTDRQDLLRPVLSKIGIGALIGEEVKVARIGQLERMITKAQSELKGLKKSAPLIREDGED